jgi:hypothetical protein
MRLGYLVGLALVIACSSSPHNSAAKVVSCQTPIVSKVHLEASALKGFAGDEYAFDIPMRFYYQHVTSDGTTVSDSLRCQISHTSAIVTLGDTKAQATTEIIARMQQYFVGLHGYYVTAGSMRGSLPVLVGN